MTRTPQLRPAAGERAWSRLARPQSRTDFGGAEPPLVLVSAIADHPWVDEGAAMCIAMTVVYAGLSFQGINLVGKGLPLTAEQGLALGYRLVALPLIIRPHINALEKLVAFTLSSPATLLVLSSRAHELGSLGRGC